jgi:hypothetical protein
MNQILSNFMLILLMITLAVACQKDQLEPEESAQNLTATVDTRGANEAVTMVNNLAAQVEEMMNQGNIGHGPGTSILSKLRNITSKLERGQISVALSQLNALLVHLEGLVDEGTLSPGIAEGLIFDVETIACEANPDCEPLDMLTLPINTGTETYTLYIHPGDQRVSGVNPVPWGGYQTDTELPNYATASAAKTDFNGYENTEVIVATVDNLPAGETNYAAKVCADLVDGGYSDWYLPALGELMPMLNELDRYADSTFAASFYWSSTEASASGAWRPYFNPNYNAWIPWVAGKYFYSGSCRCVRKWDRG